MTTFDSIVYQILSDKIGWCISKTNKLELHNKSLHSASVIGSLDPPPPGENSSGGSRISYGAPTPEGYLAQFLAKNCTKIKEIGPRASP